MENMIGATTMAVILSAAVGWILWRRRERLEWHSLPEPAVIGRDLELVAVFSRGMPSETVVNLRLACRRGTWILDHDESEAGGWIRTWEEIWSAEAVTAVVGKEARFLLTLPAQLPATTLPQNRPVSSEQPVDPEIRWSCALWREHRRVRGAREFNLRVVSPSSG